MFRRFVGSGGLHPLPPNGSSACAVFWRLAPLRLMVVSFFLPFGPLPLAGFPAPVRFLNHPCRRCLQLIRPLLTSRSVSKTSPFQASSEISPGKSHEFPRAIAGSTPLPLGRESFAASCPLALVGSASYPVPVRRLAVSLPLLSAPTSRSDRVSPASSPCGSLGVVATDFPRGLPPPIHAHAGHTRKPPGSSSGGSPPP